MIAPRTYAALVSAVGHALYGTTWVEHLSRDLAVAKRGVERVKAAAAAGDDYPAAKGYLDGLRQLIEQRRALLDGLDGELVAAIDRRTAERAARA
jgi:hypothetical protein